MTKPKEMKSGLETSINAAYTAKEIRDLLQKSKLSNGIVETSPFGLTIYGIKNK